MSNSGKKTPTASKAERCPVCRKPAIPAFAPFCSRGCRDRDLISWLDERYILPGKPTDVDEDG